MKRYIALLILIHLSTLVFSQTLPTAYNLSSIPFFMGSWSADASAGTYPEGMVFQEYIYGQEPGASSEPLRDWLCAYNIGSRSRFEGMGEWGIGMVNTGSEQDDYDRCGNGTELGGKVGVVVLALNTLDMQDIELSWKVRLIEKGNGTPMPREYRVMAQYRVETTDSWTNFPLTSVYSSSGKETDSFQEFIVNLPAVCEGQPYIQIRWKYYQENSNQGGSRPFVALDDIKVVGRDINTGYAPYVFLGSESLGNFGCVQGGVSQIDSLLISGVHLSSNLTITSSGNFYISTDKSNVNSKNLVLGVTSGNLNERYIYIRKVCQNTSVENGTLRFISGSYQRTFSLRGEGYYQLYINELMASNFLTLYENLSRDYPDWIEIYNPNNETVRVGGYYISDNKDQLNKHQLSNVIFHQIGANGFRTYYASGNPNLSINHLNFSLSSHGESIFLVGKDGKTIIDSVTYGGQETDYSYGRMTDGGSEWTIFEKSTPDRSNGIGKVALDKSTPPSFSHIGGWYGQIFNLSITSENPEAKIYFTIDGSTPSVDNIGGFVFEYKQSYPRIQGDEVGDSYFRPYRSYFYYEPIDMSMYRNKSFWLSDVNEAPTAVPYILQEKRDHATVIRAIVIEPGKAPSPVVTHTYFFGEDAYVKDNLPIVALTVNEEEFKGFYNGISVAGVDYERWRVTDTSIVSRAHQGNYTRTGRTAEITANMEVFKDGGRGYNQLVGLRTHGATSRRGIYKSYRIYGRNRYGSESIKYPFFENLPYEEFRRIIIRNTGSHVYRTYFKDAFLQRLMRTAKIDYQEHKPIVTYINGEYWGIYEVRERLDVHYFCRKYGFDEDKIDLLSSSMRVESGNNSHYKTLYDLVQLEEKLSDSTLKIVETMMDIENYLDYYSFQVYIANKDWPFNNIMYWRYKTDKYNSKAPYGLDGRWRWAIFDTDQAFFEADLNFNAIDGAMFPIVNIETDWANVLFRSLISNATFRQRFITRYSDLLNTYYMPERVLSEIKSYVDKIQEDIPNHMNRWTSSEADTWFTNVKRLENYATQRPSYAREHMKKSFELDVLQTVTLDVDDVNNGYIKINTIEIEKNTPGVDFSKVYPWKGVYFKNLPVTLVPIPNVGYKFSHWELTDSVSYTDTLVFELTKDIFAKAFFIIDENYKYSPEPAIIDDCPYEFTEWSGNQTTGSAPENMAFYYTTFPDSKANGTLDGRLDSIRYDHDSRTRINGLGINGISLINTADANENYYETRLGAVAVAVNTEKILAADVSFKAGTVRPQSKKYSIRLQYRVSDRGEVFDFYDKNGNLVEYHGSMEQGDEQLFYQIELPDNLLKKKYVQLIWRYYYNGQQIDLSTNARDELRIDDIVIRQRDIVGFEPVEEFTSKIIANPNSNIYQWYKCENDSLILLEDETQQELLITAPGIYAVEVDYGMCAHVSECSFFFVKEHINFAPSIFSQILPNPSNGIFELVFDEIMRDVTISMVDIAGNVVDVRKYTETQKISYDARKFSKGIYVLDISTRDGRKGTQKVVVQ